MLEYKLYNTFYNLYTDAEDFRMNINININFRGENVGECLVDSAANYGTNLSHDDTVINKLKNAYKYISTNDNIILFRMPTMNDAYYRNILHKDTIHDAYRTSTYSYVSTLCNSLGNKHKFAVGGYGPERISEDGIEIFLIDMGCPIMPGCLYSINLEHIPNLKEDYKEEWFNDKYSSYYYEGEVGVCLLKEFVDVEKLPTTDTIVQMLNEMKCDTEFENKIKFDINKIDVFKVKPKNDIINRLIRIRRSFLY